MSDWISVKDGLPTSSGSYLVYANVVDIDIYDAEEGEWEFWCNWKVTHWQPLPDSPEGD